MSGSADSKTLLLKIDALVRQRMVAEKVVSINDLKSFKRKQTPRILIIEDDEFVRKSLQRILETQKYSVVTAVDARELSSVVESFLFDLILLDIGLPWINGLELAELMKEHEQIKNIPLVFISGHNEMDMIKKGFSVGADDYLTKPFDLDRVVKTVKTLLELNS